MYPICVNYSYDQMKNIHVLIYDIETKYNNYFAEPKSSFKVYIL